MSATQPITEDEGGEFYEMFLEWNDEKYSKRLSKRVREGLDTSVNNGTFCGGFLIYGYKIRKEPIAGKNDRYIKYVEIDEEQAEIMRFVFEQYDNGIEKKHIAEALNAKGHRLNGKPFRGRSFDRWMVNPKYTGQFYYGNRECSNMFPAIIDKPLFDRVQERIKKNRYFNGGTATALREPYLLTGKIKCGHCDTPMVSDGGTGKLGKQHYYYACKARKKGKCDKKRENKNNLEIYVVNSVIEFLSDPKNIEIIVNDVLAYYEKRTCESSIKSVEGKIAQIKKEVEELASAYVTAKSNLLRDTIERKMNDHEILLEDLMSELGQLEYERGKRITKQDLFAFVSELLRGNPTDKDFQRKIIDNLVSSVYAYDDVVVTYFNIKGGKNVEQPTLEATNKGLGDILGVQTQQPPPRHDNLPNYKFGQKLGISANAISQWKTGKACPTFLMFIRLADYFGVSLDYLSGRVDDDVKYTPKQNLPLFPERLMYVLKERGITWYRVVKETRINDSNMRNWRRGSLPLIPMLVELADHIGVSIDYLVGCDR